MPGRFELPSRENLSVLRSLRDFPRFAPGSVRDAGPDRQVMWTSPPEPPRVAIRRAVERMPWEPP